jgi:pimeloyl-ACP methyl ester carboxylesterase
VVTYDRRGSRVARDPDGWATTSVLEHAEDAAALLRALHLPPAAVVGHSSGAAIACSPVASSQVVQHAVIYEPNRDDPCVTRSATNGTSQPTKHPAEQA